MSVLMLAGNVLRIKEVRLSKIPASTPQNFIQS